MINWEELKVEWETTDISLADLATKHDVKLGTLKSRKSREKWLKGATALDATSNPKDATILKVDATAKKETRVQKKVAENEETPINENGELTDKQWLFCLYYTQYWNATKAYQKAYDAPYEQAMPNASRLIRNDKVRTQINVMKEDIACGIMIDATVVLQKWIDIAFSNIGDYLDYGTEEVDLMDEEGLPLVDENGDKRTYQRSYVRFKEGASLDNTVVSEVKQGKDGVSIKLYDKVRALEFLSKYTDLLDDRTKTQLQNEKTKVDAVNAALKQQHENDMHQLKLDQAKLNVQKTKAELEKINDPDADKDITINFVRKGDAL